jgi:hypothetical protein
MLVAYLNWSPFSRQSSAWVIVLWPRQSAARMHTIGSADAKGYVGALVLCVLLCLLVYTSREPHTFVLQRKVFALTAARLSIESRL